MTAVIDAVALQLNKPGTEAVRPIFTGDRRLAGIDPALGIDVRLIR